MILINGKEQGTIEAIDRGLHYGDGLFETIAIHRGRPRLWHAHMQRLEDGCRRLSLPPVNISQLADEVEWLCGDDERSILKLIITRGPGERGYRMPTSTTPTRVLMRHPWSDELSRQEITARLCHTTLGHSPALAGIKHLNRLEQVLARNEWDDPDINEGLLCDEGGNLIEGVRSNLFVVKAGKLLTPDLSRCGVAGVMRHTVLALAVKLGIPHAITTIRREELEQMEEVFVTNALVGIQRVMRCDDLIFKGDHVTRRLQLALQHVLEGVDA